ncbi:MAG: magnesium transporter [Candidatus Atribacteria bacterium]|nr:magnesium transporter [Candidatus Atribacteria bacterium]
METKAEFSISETREKIIQLLQRGSFIQVKEEINTLHPVDIAEIISHLDQKDQVVLFRLLKKDIAIEVFEQLDFEQQENLLKTFTDERAAEILNQMSPDDRMGLFDELPAKVVKNLLQLLNPKQREMVTLMLGYPENSAARIMNPNLVDLKETYTVEQSLARIRKINPPEELIYTAYVIDAERHLLGKVTLRDLILSPPGSLIKNIMEKEVIYVHTDDDQEKVARTIQKYDLLTIPVVDRENRLVGVVTIDDAIDIIDEETTEDIHRLVAIQTSEDEYLHSSIGQRIKSRFIWLAVLLIGGTLTSIVLQNYSQAIQTVVALSFFVPMLIDTGGNVGSQSTAIMVRGLAIQEVNRRNLWKLVFSEVLIGSVLGFLLGWVGVLRVILLQEDWVMGIVVGLSIWTVVIVSNLVGAILPFILKKIKIDPAVSATPLITTLIDVIGIVIYLQIAQLLLQI